MTAYEIIHAEQAGWQRRAAAELGRILAEHPGLPALAWTVGPAGATLSGRVGGLVPAARVRADFDAWRAALALGEHQPGTGAGVTHLHAAAYRNRVRVTLSATVCDDDEGDVR
ncbi:MULTISPECIES: hypothetical protein [unclassified Frankia]|uniref:hypothetical protein n=1 Tax=unclassified Frankia TaxID=2632575 RepID=UPI000461824F|nr:MULTISPECIES: hypothetical protein [unclassified Frankia]KDA41263.1 hypothetical protein BMG523Draft_03895 [Frankia sp. BMG5.23]KPM50620.1 hypothetical protein ACG83_39480 [Frankia sp. R43]KPM52561.1 hypothetical protein ACG83_30105 [Frankia sp. R43]KPM55408.1 hypothetical protein ACG83_08490 [Frankia sp. R43]